VARLGWAVALQRSGTGEVLGKVAQESTVWGGKLGGCRWEY